MYFKLNKVVVVVKDNKTLRTVRVQIYKILINSNRTYVFMFNEKKSLTKRHYLLFPFFSSAEMDLTQATAALAALIKYLEVTFENLVLSMVKITKPSE